MRRPDSCNGAVYTVCPERTKESGAAVTSSCVSEAVLKPGATFVTNAAQPDAKQSRVTHTDTYKSRSTEACEHGSSESVAAETTETMQAQVVHGQMMQAYGSKSWSSQRWSPRSSQNGATHTGTQKSAPVKAWAKKCGTFKSPKTTSISWPSQRIGTSGVRLRLQCIPFGTTEAVERCRATTER